MSATPGGARQGTILLAVPAEGRGPVSPPVLPPISLPLAKVNRRVRVSPSLRKYSDIPLPG